MKGSSIRDAKYFVCDLFADMTELEMPNWDTARRYPLPAWERYGDDELHKDLWYYAHTFQYFLAEHPQTANWSEYDFSTRTYIPSYYFEKRKQRKQEFDFEELAKENTALKEENSRLKRMLFGTRSEKSAKPKKPDTEKPDSPAGDKRKPANRNNVRAGDFGKRGRKPLSDRLPRERVVHELSACPHCKGPVAPSGLPPEESEQMDVVPVLFFVKVHVQKKYRCACCGLVTAPGPRHIIEKSSYSSPGFLAHVACSRYQHNLPFYRLEDIFEQSGITISRTTLANLMIGCADKLVPIYETLKEVLLKQDVIHADETTAQVLKEPERKPQAQSFMWTYRSGKHAPQQVVLFDYRQTRAGEHPEQFLGDFNGYLQVDGYAGYNGLTKVKRVGCWAHARRKFMEAIDVLPEGTHMSPAHYAVSQINRLYEVEKKIEDLTEKERHRLRQEESVPVLREFRSWLDEMRHSVVPKTLLGKAINYSLGQWDALARYVEDGRLSMDNNIVEREIKPFVIGRKNWLFADSMDGMHANAVMYSLVQTAKANGIDPFDYLKYVMETIPKLRTASEVEALLPWNAPLVPAKDKQRMAA